MSGGIFVGMERAIIDGFHTVLDGLTSTYSGWMAGIFVSCLTAYITWRGYQTLAGKLDRPVEDVVWDIGKMMIIMAFVTNAGGWLDLSISAINGIRDGVSGDESIWVLLDKILEKAQYLGETLYNNDDSTYVPAKGLFAEAIVWISIAFMVGITGFVNLIAELVLMLMTITAPIFIFCLMWGWLRPMFNNWLQTIFSCILTVLFSGFALQVVMNYINTVLDAAVKWAGTANFLTLAVQVGLSGFGAGIVMFVVYRLSSILAGAAAQGAIQGMAFSGMGQGFSGGKKSVNSVRENLGSIGNRAADNLKYNSSTTNTTSAKNARAASIQTVQRMNSQR
jgi:type IV secretion system protein VirB6